MTNGKVAEKPQRICATDRMLLGSVRRSMEGESGDWRRYKRRLEMKSIVLAYDGSDPAKRALERTGELANGAAVTVVSAVQVLATGGRATAIVDEDEVAARKQDLTEAAAYLRSKGIEPQAVEAHGIDVGKTIVDEAREVNADLIVVGSSGKNLAKRVVLGSVSSKVVHGAPCDVLIVL